MFPNFYTPTTRPAGSRLRRQLLTLAAALLLAPAARAQTDIEVPIGNPNTLSARQPLASYFRYERSTMIYTAGEIGGSGNVTQVGFYLNAATAPLASPTKIYLKTVANATFSAATTYTSELNGATLVFDGTVGAAAYVPGTWVSVPLSAPFAYNGTSNLEVIVETNLPSGATDASTGKLFRHSTNGAGFVQAQYWRADSNLPNNDNGALSVTRPNLCLSGLTPLPCAPARDLRVTAITPTSAQLAFTPATGTADYTITYTPAGGAPITLTASTSPVALTGLTAGTRYTVSIAGNCGSSTAPVYTTAFSTTTTGLVNDECAGAVLLTAGTTCSVTLGSNVGATPSAGVPAPGPRPVGGCFPAQYFAKDDVWYRLVVPASGVVRVTTSAATGSALNDTGVILYSGACGALAEEACNDDNITSGTRFSQATATGLVPGSTLYIRVWGVGLTSSGAFNICAIEMPANDAAVVGLFTLSKVSGAVNQTVPVQAAIRNLGGVGISNRTVQLTVTGSSTYSATQTISSLASEATTTVTFPGFPISVFTGANTITVSLPNDDQAANNTRSLTQRITLNELSYLDETQPLNSSGIGLSSTVANGILAVRYTTSGSVPLSSVRVHFPASSSTTSTYQVVVFDATGTGGRPGAELFASPTLNRPTAAGPVVVPTPGVRVNGGFYVGVREISGNIGVGYQEEDPLRPSTFYTRTGSSTTWNDISTQGSTVRPRLALEAVFSVGTATRSAELAQAISLYPNPAHGAFTLRLPALPGARTAQLTLLNALGQAVQTRTLPLAAAGTETQMDVRGLAAGIYTLRVLTGEQVATKQLVVE